MSLLEAIVNLLLWPPLFYFLIFPGLVFVMIFEIFAIWSERKIAGRVQMRYGPLEISPRLGGALQLIADLIRYALQEVIIPRTVDKLPFVIAPIAAFIIALMPLLVTPFSPTFLPIGTESGILIAAALTTIPPLLLILAGWASNNKFSLVGSARESFLIATYEVIILLTIAAMALLYGTLDFVKAVEAQQALVWGLLLNPLAAITYFVAVMMGTSRFPFEIAEAESEIVMGAFTEYSGIMFGLAMGISYARMFVYNIIFVLLFLGGWSPLGGITTGSFLLDSIVLPGLSVAVKATLISILMVFMRSIYGRYRIDQALNGGWGFWFIMALFSIGLSTIVVYVMEVL